MRVLVPLVTAFSLLPASISYAQSPAVQAGRPAFEVAPVRPNTTGVPVGTAGGEAYQTIPSLTLLAPVVAQQPGLPARETAQRPQTGTARIRGRVLASPGNSPLRRAQITLTGADDPQFRRVVTTDVDGRYEIAELPAGRFLVWVTRSGYVTLEYGQRRPFEPGMPISLRDGETMAPIDFALPKGGVILVRLLDEFGEPVAGASVQAQRFQWGADGQRRLTNVRAGGLVSLGGTDDRGDIRLFGLAPGEYVIEARAGLGQGLSEGFARTFYPGTMSVAQAQPVSVGIGEEVSIQYTVETGRSSVISGVVVDSQGKPAAGASISLATVSGNSVSFSVGARARPDGTFTLSGVAPGEHSLRFNLGGGEAPESAAIPVLVTGDMIGMSVMLAAGATITGRVVYEGTPPSRAQGWPTPLRVKAVDGPREVEQLDNATGGDADPDGNFRINNAEGRILFNVPGLPPTWIIKSVTLGGKDITDVPLELAGRRNVSDVRVTLTNRLTQVGGFVTDDKGQNLPDYVVVIQPAEQKDSMLAARIVRAARPDTNGRFEVRGLRPGRYLATAIESMEQNRHYSPEFQKELRRGAREFTVREGETMTLDLRLTPGL